MFSQSCFSLINTLPECEMLKGNSQRIQDVKSVVCTYAMVSYMLLMNEHQAATKPQFEVEIY